MELRLNNPDPSKSFHAKRAGAGLCRVHRCSHGSPSISLHFFNAQDGKEVDLGVLLPACVAPQLFGAVIALIEASGGPEVSDSFVKRMFAAAEETSRTVAARLTEREEARKHCCEASYRTGGREHTCKHDAQPTS
jgi:hypothetical protein